MNPKHISRTVYKKDNIQAENQSLKVPEDADDIVLKRDVSRKIVHIDMDAFFASVEQHDHPELRGKAIAVGHGEGRGVVATASYEARRFGVRSAMPSVRAKELCPHLIFVPTRMQRYKEVSRQVQEIFSRYTDLIEPLSLDEAFLDVTHNKKGIVLGVDVAIEIKRAIREETGLVASAGVSYNKFLAKIASDWRKPDGLCTIHPDRAIQFIDTLPIEAFWGVGPATAKRFRAMGVSNARELRALSLSTLTARFGSSGVIFYKFVRGIDDRPVRPERVRKSVGCERTLERDLADPESIDLLMTEVAVELMARLVRADFVGRTLTLKLRYADFTTRTRAISLEHPFNNVDGILEEARKLLAGFTIPRSGIRLLGLTVSSPLQEREDEPSLFDW